MLVNKKASKNEKNVAKRPPYEEKVAKRPYQKTCFYFLFGGGGGGDGLLLPSPAGVHACNRAALIITTCIKSNY